MSSIVDRHLALLQHRSAGPLAFGHDLNRIVGRPRRGLAARADQTTTGVGILHGHGVADLDLIEVRYVRRQGQRLFRAVGAAQGDLAVGAVDAADLRRRRRRIGDQRGGSIGGRRAAGTPGGCARTSVVPASSTASVTAAADAMSFIGLRKYRLEACARYARRRRPTSAKHPRQAALPAYKRARAIPYDECH